MDALFWMDLSEIWLYFLTILLFTQETIWKWQGEVKGFKHTLQKTFFKISAITFNERNAKGIETLFSCPHSFQVLVSPFCRLMILNLFITRLEHNLSKNLYKGLAFCDKTQIKTIEYGLIDTIKKEKQIILILYSFAHSHMNLKRFWCQKEFWQHFCHKKSWSLGIILI